VIRDPQLLVVQLQHVTISTEFWYNIHWNLRIKHNSYTTIYQLWQTAWNRIFRVRLIIVRIYFYAYSPIRDGQIQAEGGFAVHILSDSL
jgi:hypothetical protein